MDTPHEDCRLCQQMVKTREYNIRQHEYAIALAREDIAEIEHGERHTLHHEILIKEER
jgi:ribosomal protein S5